MSDERPSKRCGGGVEIRAWKSNAEWIRVRIEFVHARENDIEV